MAYLQVFKIVTNVKKFSNIFIEKNLCKWTHTVQTYVGQGASAFVDEWIKEAVTCTLCADESKNMDLTEAGEIKKRWQEYTENLYKMSLLLK